MKYGLIRWTFGLFTGAFIGMGSILYSVNDRKFPMMFGAALVILFLDMRYVTNRGATKEGE